MLMPEGGWRLPTTADFDALVAAVGATTSNGNWGKLFKDYNGSSSFYTNEYGTDWNASVGYYYLGVKDDECIGWYNSTTVIHGGYGRLMYTNSRVDAAPIVFVKDA